MHWEPKTELKKHFRMPRYTGVTLSLLSMMVLASMLVVWKKIQPEGKCGFEIAGHTGIKRKHSRNIKSLSRRIWIRISHNNL